MATTIDLSPESEERLNLLASETGRSKEYFLREIVERGMEVIEDYYLPIEVLKRVRSENERVYTSAEIKRDLGLEN
jgi:RHH-type rel operon transcriptional repressor/antitoxin RelB